MQLTVSRAHELHEHDKDRFTTKDVKYKPTNLFFSVSSEKSQGLKANLKN